jgi:tetratricopeptide (TPR) repeat protein
MRAPNFGSAHAGAIMRTLLLALLVALGTTSMPVAATPIVPTHDDEVIDVLPAAINGGRAEARRLRQQLANAPRDPALALAAATRYLEQAHELSDPRFAGMAMAALAPWQDEASMPDDVLMMRATLQQYLHEFDASAASLQRLVARPGLPRPQAWLTLATVRRVQGRYADSDAACQQVARAGVALHANACLAENAALRGEVARARSSFVSLLADRRLPGATAAWLTTSLAELEQRAGNAAAADAAYQAALKLAPDAYAMLAYADFLIEQQRPAQALALLKSQTRSDAVLLRLAIAGTQAGAASATPDVAEMRERIALANERPDAKVFHGREQAMFALAVDRDAERAWELARGNAAQQREPLDLLVLAQAARARGDAAALQQARQLAREIGLRDRRIEGLL